MKKYFTLAATVLLATAAVSFAGPDKAALEAKENAAWQAYKDKNADAFQKVVDKDIKCVYDAGIFDMQKELSDMKTADVKSFAITNFMISTDTPDVVTATYTVKVEGSSGGHLGLDRLEPAQHATVQRVVGGRLPVRTLCHRGEQARAYGIHKAAVAAGTIVATIAQVSIARQPLPAFGQGLERSEL